MKKSEIGMLTHSEITRGIDSDTPLDLWQAEADAWTIRLCSDLSREKLGAGNWPTFHFFKGPGLKGEPPSVSDLIFSVASDCSFLECEPEEIDYATGKKIEHNGKKMTILFGYQLWEKIKQYTEEEIQEAFGEFS